MKSGDTNAILRELRELERRLRVVERKAAAIRRTSASSPRIQFWKKYPGLDIDPGLFKLVGIDSPVRVRQEKRAIREAIAAWFDTRP